MTKQEIHAINRAIEHAESVTLPSVTIEFVDGKMIQTELMPRAERDRLFASEDFKRGWAMCHAELKDKLAFITTANKQDLIRYAGKAKGSS